MENEKYKSYKKRVVKKENNPIVFVIKNIVYKQLSIWEL